mmetsp:Transcript_28408/g.42025  ORF Transcript_28408/g.42025 Transcript_28408/m.42025 type:complete len:250 (-) Transcript_28408:1904-2653(-)
MIELDLPRRSFLIQKFIKRFICQIANMLTELLPSSPPFLHVGHENVHVGFDSVDLCEFGIQISFRTLVFFECHFRVGFGELSFFAFIGDLFEGSFNFCFIEIRCFSSGDWFYCVKFFGCELDWYVAFVIAIFLLLAVPSVLSLLLFSGLERQYPGLFQGVHFTIYISLQDQFLFRECLLQQIKFFLFLFNGCLTLLRVSHKALHFPLHHIHIRHNPFVSCHNLLPFLFQGIYFRHGGIDGRCDLSFYFS